MEDVINRGQIYYADLDRTVIGSEQTGIRPVVILQNNLGNRNSPTVIIAPITSKYMEKAKLPTHVNLQPLKKRLPKKSIILLEQIKTIDKSRLKSLIGTLNIFELKAVDKALMIALGIGKIHSSDFQIKDTALAKKDDSEYLTRKQIACYGIVAKEYLRNAGNLEISDQLLCNYILTLMEIYKPDEIEKHAKRYIKI